MSIKKRHKGGKVIAAGGFGCVFKPPLSCVANQSKIDSRSFVTKLMTDSAGNAEMKEVRKIIPLVKKLPNYKRYFIIDDIFMCGETEELTPDDKIDFNKKCNNLTRRHITAENVNDNLDKLSALYIPYGGVPAAKLIQDTAKQLSANQYDAQARRNFGVLNWGLIDVLENAIIPMNNKGLLHLDLKGDNMLIDEHYTSRTVPAVKLIDWGLAATISENYSKIPDIITNRPFMYNAPFSNILFNRTTQSTIAKFSNAHVVTPYISTAVLKTLALEIIGNSVTLDGSGHIEYIEQALQQLSIPLNNKSIDVEILQYNQLLPFGYIMEYITEVLRVYLIPKVSINKFEFAAEKYFNDIYRHNCDIWGFLTIYFDFIQAFSLTKYD